MNKGMLAIMYPPSLFQQLTSLSVSDLTRYIRQMMESDEILQNVWVQGEISNLARPASGHIYFTLKDANASLRCVLWRGSAGKLKITLQEGMSIEAHGRINVYEAAGQYQLNTDLIRPLGQGVLYQEFLRLKGLLEDEGLFDKERKRSIPLMVKKIGIVTSPSGAALKDMINTIKRRNPLVEVTLAGSMVQGDDAPEGLVKALENLNHKILPDLILVARGGGSIEDLWAFNTESVVRAIAASQAPVITGIGHETDFTLSDFAADLRAPTPTAAAELATPLTVDEMKNNIDNARNRVFSVFQGNIDLKMGEALDFRKRLHYCSPARHIQTSWQGLDSMTHRMLSARHHRLKLDSTRLKGVSEHLSSLNPTDVLKRGYSVVTRELDDQLISHIGQVEVGDRLSVRVKDGNYSVVASDQPQERK